MKWNKLLASAAIVSFALTTTSYSEPLSKKPDKRYWQVATCFAVYIRAKNAPMEYGIDLTVRTSEQYGIQLNSGKATPIQRLKLRAVAQQIATDVYRMDPSEVAKKYEECSGYGIFGEDGFSDK